jgi:hypothetical protein
MHFQKFTACDYQETPVFTGSSGIGKTIFILYLLIRWIFFDELKDKDGKLIQCLISNFDPNNKKIVNHKSKNESSIFYRNESGIILIHSTQEFFDFSAQKFDFNFQYNIKDFSLTQIFPKTLSIPLKYTFLINDNSTKSGHNYDKKHIAYICSIGQKFEAGTLYQKDFYAPLPTFSEIIEISKLVKEEQAKINLKENFKLIGPLIRDSLKYTPLILNQKISQTIENILSDIKNVQFIESILSKYDTSCQLIFIFLPTDFNLTDYYFKFSSSYTCDLFIKLFWEKEKPQFPSIYNLLYNKAIHSSILGIFFEHLFANFALENSIQFSVQLFSYQLKENNKL